MRRPGVFVPRQRRRSGQPARVPPHDLHDGHRTGIIHARIPDDFLHGGGDELGRRAEARGMVGLGQVVVDRFGHPGDLDVLALLGKVARELGHRVHRIVPADVEEITDLILVQRLQQPAVHLAVLPGAGSL